MSGLKAVARITLAEQVALQVADMIAGNRWKAGDRLPPEMELCSALNVGRSTLREALKSLAFVGMVRMRAGDGTYVAEPSRGLLDRILAKGLLKTEKDLADVCETRIVLETQLAALAAERVTRKGLAHLKELVREGEQSLRGQGRSYIDIDLDFHLAIADCSGNRLLPRLLADIRGLLVEWIAKSQELPGVRRNAQEQHERIFKSIADKNPEAARNEMQAHLETFQRAYKLLGRISGPDITQKEKAAR
ncbi:MAG TPA: FadR/GntR family transcriptional regulator [Bryobacteraceae bacterium]|nr:FadR/GntR family transcriptional regulator [Bryobacteraceae bacterium]